MPSIWVTFFVIKTPVWYSRILPSPNLHTVFPTNIPPPLHPRSLTTNQLYSVLTSSIFYRTHLCVHVLPSPFNYQPAGHVITGDVNIVRNEELKSLILKGPKFREPQSFKWQQNSISITDSVENYARRRAKSEKEELDSLSEWVKSIRAILKSRIKHFRSKMHTIYPSAFNKPEAIEELNRLHEECFGSSRQSL
jgi:hypothetical protein